MKLSKLQFLSFTLLTFQISFAIRRFERQVSDESQLPGISFAKNELKNYESFPSVGGAARSLDRQFERQGLPPPVIPGFNGGDVSSYTDARLDLDLASELFAVPGQLVNIVFLLTNLGDPKFFYISVNERQGGFFPDAGSSFPGNPGQQLQFLNGLSEQRPFLRRNETRNIVISLRIPPNVPIGANKTITIEAQPEGFGGGLNNLVRRFFFTVDSQRPDFYDRRVPYCEVLEDTRSTQCYDVINNPVNCRLRRWGGRFYFEDYDSGLRTLLGRERFDFSIFDLFFTHTNFVIGSKTPAYFSFMVSCCINSYSVTAYDLAGNEDTCVAGDGATNRFGSTQIAITVIVLLVVLGATLGGAAFVIIRKRRRAELAKMKYLQNPR